MGHSALFLLKTLYGDPRPGVADGYSLSRPHGNLRSRDFPAVRDGESIDAVIIGGDVLGNNTVSSFSLSKSPSNSLSLARSLSSSRCFLDRLFSVTFAERPIIASSLYSLAKQASRFTSYSTTRSRNSSRI